MTESDDKQQRLLILDYVDFYFSSFRSTPSSPPVFSGVRFLILNDVDFNFSPFRSTPSSLPVFSGVRFLILNDVDFNFSPFRSTQSSPRVFSGVRFALSLIFCSVCGSFLSFDHCIFCTSIHGF